MESIPSIINRDNDRRPLGEKPTKTIENKIEKLTLYDTKNNPDGILDFPINELQIFKHNYNINLGLIIKHVEDLTQIDLYKLSPSEFIKIFNLFNRTLYYNKKLYSSLFKATISVITYFNIDELLSLIEFIGPFGVAKNSIGSLNLISDNQNGNGLRTSEITTVSEENNEFYEIQNVLLTKAIESLDNKIKFNTTIKGSELLELYSNCLKIINKFAFSDSSKLLISIAQEMTENLIGEVSTPKTVDFDTLLTHVNNVSDTLSHKTIDLICKIINSNKYKIQTCNVVDDVTLSLLEHDHLIQGYYSSGDIQTLNFLVNYYHKLDFESFDKPSPEVISDLHTCCKLSFNLFKLFLFLKEKILNDNITLNMDSFLVFNFKLLYCSKILKNFDTQTFNEVFYVKGIYDNVCKFGPEILTPHSKSLTCKNQSILLSILSEYKVIPPKDYETTYEFYSKTPPNTPKVDDFESCGTNLFINENNNQFHEPIRTVVHNIGKNLDLTILDSLNVLETSYNSFGYLNHFSTKKLLDHTLSQFPKNPLEAMVLLRVLMFSFKLPFNLMSVNRSNIERSMRFLENFRSEHSQTNYQEILYHLNRNELNSGNKLLCEFDNHINKKWDLKKIKGYSRSILGDSITGHMRRIKSLAILL